TVSTVLLTSKRNLRPSSVKRIFRMSICWASIGSLMIRVSWAAISALSNKKSLRRAVGSTKYQFFPSEVSYTYQKRSEWRSQLGLTDVEKIIFLNFSGENRDANW